MRVAAVIGDTIDADAVPVLAQVADLDFDSLADHLDVAADERIVVSAHAGDGYAFAHGLLRDHLLAGLTGDAPPASAPAGGGRVG